MGGNTAATSSPPSSDKMAEERNAVSGTTTVSPSEHHSPACFKTVLAIKGENMDKNNAPKNNLGNSAAPSGPPSTANTATKSLRLFPRLGTDGHDIKGSTSRCYIKNPCTPSTAKTAEKRTAVYSPPTTPPTDKDDVQNMGRNNPPHCCEGISNNVCAEKNVLDSSTDGLQCSPSTTATPSCPPSTARTTEERNAVSRTTTTSPSEDQPPEEIKTTIYDSQGNINYAIIHCPLDALKQVAPSVFQIIVEHPWNNMSCHEQDVHHDWLVHQVMAVKQGKLAHGLHMHNLLGFVNIRLGGCTTMPSRTTYGTTWRKNGVP